MSDFPLKFLVTGSLLLVATGCALAQELPPGVPSPIGPDGKFTHAISFTTPAYQKEAFKLVLQEANQAARDLHLPEKLPITEADVVRRFIPKFGFAYAAKAVGNVATRDYAYYVSHGNKLSYVEGTHQDSDCFYWMDHYKWPKERLDTNGAYQLAINWLAAASMDVKALNQECQTQIRLYPIANPVKDKKGRFVPVYDVCWISPENKANNYGDVASVRVFTPTKTLVSLRVEDPKYMLRKPLVFTNLAELLSQTNSQNSTNGRW